MSIKNRLITQKDFSGTDMANAIDPTRSGPICYVSPFMHPKKKRTAKGCKMYIEDIQRIRGGN